MATRHPAGLVALAPHDVAARAHRAGDDPEVVDVGLDRTLARDPCVETVVRLALGEVVMTVDSLGLTTLADEVEDHPHRVVHHLVTIRPRVVLGPEHVADVRLELGRALEEVREIRILEAQLEVLRQSARLGDVLLRELVAEAPRAGVQDRPDPAALIDAELEEVVARAERAELL